MREGSPVVLKISPIFSNAPLYIIPDDTDPVEIIRSITRQQRDKYRALLCKYAESEQDIYFVVTGDGRTNKLSGGVPKSIK